MSLINNIRNKINSIENTIKITQAMKMIASSKLKNIKYNMKCSKNYFKNIKKTIFQIFYINKFNIFFKKKYNNKKIIFILITTDKGLCGNLNINIINSFFIKKKKLNLNLNYKTIIIGDKGLNILKKEKIFYFNKNKNILDIKEINKLTKIIFNLYNKKIYNSIYIIYTKYINILKQKTKIKKILPITLENKKDINYIYEPNKKIIIKKILFNYIKSYIYKCIIENYLSEETSRMITMHSANKNANNLNKNLKLKYNKIRQSEVTKELIEIISGNILKN